MIIRCCKLKPILKGWFTPGTICLQAYCTLKKENHIHKITFTEAYLYTHTYTDIKHTIQHIRIKEKCM